VHRELLEAGGDAAGVLQRPDAVLDDVAPPVRGAIECRLAPRTMCTEPDLVPALGDDGAYAVAAQPCADAGVAVTLVAGEGRGPAARPDGRTARYAHGIEHLCGVAALVRLAGAQRHGEREPRAVSGEVQLAFGHPW